jgi:hypothetical protein
VAHAGTLVAHLGSSDCLSNFLGCGLDTRPHEGGGSSSGCSSTWEMGCLGCGWPKAASLA